MQTRSKSLTPAKEVEMARAATQENLDSIQKLKRRQGDLARQMEEAARQVEQASEQTATFRASQLEAEQRAAEVEPCQSQRAPLAVFSKIH